MDEFKVLILCNNPVAVPGIREFLFFGKVAAIVTPLRNKEMQHILNGMLADTGVPLLLAQKKTYRQQLTEAISEYAPQAVLMMTFPFIIPEEILLMPPKGFINFHYGLLPQCRGPQPILNHLLNNDEEAGVTLHKVDSGIDTGPVILQEKIPIQTTDTYGTLQSKLAYTASGLAANLLKILSYGSFIPAVAQDESKAAYYEMPDAARLTINWKQMKAATVERLVNACNPWNKGAGTAINGWHIGITEVSVLEDLPTPSEAGTILACNNEEGLLVASADYKKIKINIIYCAEGFFSGERLSLYGIKTGDVFS